MKEEISKIKNVFFYYGIKMVCKFKALEVPKCMDKDGKKDDIFNILLQTFITLHTTKPHKNTRFQIVHKIDTRTQSMRSRASCNRY